jgi:hypothetical protein
LSTEVEHNNNDKERERDRIDWRRSKVQELSSQGHATVVDDAIRFISSNKSKDNCISSDDSNENDKEESNEPDYDEDEDQLEEEQEDEGVPGETATTNDIL